MGVQNEVWVNSVTEALLADNSFMSAMTNDDEYVVGGSLVHKPQAGDASTVVRNRTEFPATVGVRTDTDLSYGLDEFTTNPLRLSNRDEVELSYDKMQSFLRVNTGGLLDEVAKWILYGAAFEALAGTIIGTTGAADVGTAAGATGNRKVITKKDLQNAQTILNLQNMPATDRHIVLDSNQLAQLVGDDKLYDSYERSASRVSGNLPMLFGFTIHTRSEVLTLAANNTIKAPGAATATTDNSGALFFHRSGLCKALGEIRVFENPGDPTYYGDIISMLVRAKSKHNRGDKKGYGIIANVA
jgi:hypothetical protein